MILPLPHIRSRGSYYLPLTLFPDSPSTQPLFESTWRCSQIFLIHCFRKSDLFSFAANTSVILAFLSSQLCFSISISFSSSLQVNGSYCTIMNFQDKHIHTPQNSIFWNCTVTRLATLSYSRSSSSTKFEKGQVWKQMSLELSQPGTSTGHSAAKSQLKYHSQGCSQSCPLAFWSWSSSEP